MLFLVLITLARGDVLMPPEVYTVLKFTATFVLYTIACLINMARRGPMAIRRRKNIELAQSNVRHVLLFILIYMMISLTWR